MTYTRDPVSVAFDGAARRLLDKAYANPGTWQQVWLPDPTIRQRSRYIGSNLDGPDPVPRGGGLDARTRWARAFVRAVYYQHKWNSPARGGKWSARRTPRNSGGLRIEVGRHVAASPQFDPARPDAGGLPARRRIRVQLAAGGRAKDAAVDRLAAKDRTFIGPKGHREPGPRWSDPTQREWA